MNTRLLRVLLPLVLVVSFVSACAPGGPDQIGTAPQIALVEAYAAQPGTVLEGISRVQQGLAGARLLQNNAVPTQYMFVWAQKSGGVVGFFGIDVAKKSVMDVLTILNRGGTLVNAKSANEVVQTLESQGWQIIPGGASISVAFQKAVEVATNCQKGLIAAGSTANITIITLPGGMFQSVDELMGVEIQQ